MTLQQQFESSGNWLFRYRGVLPLCVIPILGFGLYRYTYLEKSHQYTELWTMMCFSISLLGLVVRILTIGYVPKGTSGRNIVQIADSLNTTGLYSLHRNPLYFGNFLAMLGFALFLHQWSIACLASCIFALYYERIIFAEEAFLREKFGDQFKNWAARTPAFFPKLKGWVQPPNPFCWRTVLRREYTGLFLIVGGFALLDTTADSLVERHLQLDRHWVVLFLAAGTIYIVMRTLKKQTRLLHVEGR